VIKEEMTMRQVQSIPHEATFEARGERYAFSHLQQVTDPDGIPCVIDTYVCTTTQADFRCPGCHSHHTVLSYDFEAEIALVQHLWCRCGCGKVMPYDGAAGTKPRGIWRINRTGVVEVALAAVRKLRGVDLAEIELRWNSAIEQVEVSRPAGVSGMRLEDTGSEVHCWRCVIDADADDWETDDAETYGFVAEEDFAARWLLICRDGCEIWDWRGGTWAYDPGQDV
jgi:hypothetical protein